MKKLYIDHSIIARDANWPALETAAKSAVVRPVISLWNLVEIAFATDKAQMNARVGFIDVVCPDFSDHG